MHRFTNIPAIEIDAEISALERMFVNSDVLVYLFEQCDAILVTERFLDWLGIDVEENYTLEDVLRSVIQMNDDGIVCLFDYSPHWYKQAVGRKRDNKIVCLIELMDENLREGCDVAIFCSIGRPYSANGLMKKSLNGAVKIAESKAKLVSEELADG
jgi:hypothetical protein